MNPLNSAFATVLCAGRRGASNLFITARTRHLADQNVSCCSGEFQFLMFCTLVSSFPQKARCGSDFRAMASAAEISPHQR